MTVAGALAILGLPHLSGANIMSENPSIIFGDSKEAVAYALLLGIAHKLSKTHYLHGTMIVSADESWILETYSRCLKAVSLESSPP